MEIKSNQSNFSILKRKEIQSHKNATLNPKKQNVRELTEFFTSAQTNQSIDSQKKIANNSNSGKTSPKQIKNKSSIPEQFFETELRAVRDLLKLMKMDQMSGTRLKMEAAFTPFFLPEKIVAMISLYEKDHPIHLYLSNLCYTFGLGKCIKNDIKAVEYSNLAYQLALKYKDIDPEKSKIYLHVAYANGKCTSEMCKQIATLYLQNKNLHRDDVNKILEIANKLTQKKDISGLILRAKILENFVLESEERDKEIIKIYKTVEELTLKMPEEEKTSETYQILAQLYATRKVPHEYPIAASKKAYLKSIHLNKNNPTSLFELAELTRENHGKKDEYENLYKEALIGLKKNESNPDSLYKLGYCYEHGYGCTKNLNEAYKYYLKNHPSNSAQAKKKINEFNQTIFKIACDKEIDLYAFDQPLKLNEINLNDEEIKKALILSYQFLRITTLTKEINDPEKLFILAFCNQFGLGVDKNSDTALKLYKQSAIVAKNEFAAAPLLILAEISKRKNQMDEYAKHLRNAANYNNKEAKELLNEYYETINSSPPMQESNFSDEVNLLLGLNAMKRRIILLKYEEAAKNGDQNAQNVINAVNKRLSNSKS